MRRDLLGTDAGTVESEEFTGEVAHIVRIGREFAPHVVIQHTAISGFVDVGQGEIHAITFDGVGDATDEDHRAVRLHSLHDAHMGKRIVQHPVAVEVPRIVKKHEVAGMDDRSLVEGAVLAHMSIDEPDPVGCRVFGSALVQINAVFEEDGAGDAGAIIGDTAAFALNGPGADEFGRGAHDRVSAWRRDDGSAAGACVRKRSARKLDGRRGTAYERHQRDGCHDEKDSHRSHRTLTNRP